MTWAEFRIRSFAFQRKRKYEMKLMRELAYELHTTKYIFGKSKPPSKHKYWPIDDEDFVNSNVNVTQDMVEAMQKAWADYEKKKNG